MKTETNTTEHWPTSREQIRARQAQSKHSEAIKAGLNRSQSTPGPWTEDPEGVAAVSIEGSDGSIVCNVRGASNDPLCEANAHLISAAPELLAACKNTNEFALELMKRAAHIDRLLANANGTEPDCELGEIVRLRQQLGRNRAAIAKAEGSAQ